MRSSGNVCWRFPGPGPNRRAVSNGRQGYCLAYLEVPSVYAVARTIGVTGRTVTRCLERAAELGVIEALDDRPRAGRNPVNARRAPAASMSVFSGSRPDEQGSPNSAA